MSASEYTANRCPRCGATLPLDTPRGVCPRCALAGALEFTADNPGAQCLSLEDEPGRCPRCHAQVPPDHVGPCCPSCAMPLPPGSPASAGTVLMDFKDGPRSPQEEQFVGDYEVEDILGQGGMGVVYRAHHREYKEHVVALKMITVPRSADPTDFLKRFSIEIKAVAALDHDNIVKISHPGKHEGRPYFTMQFIEGGDLRREIHNDKRNDVHFPVRRAVKLIAAIARAVHHAHERGVLHRDLKPGNILIDIGGKPYVTDFGLARMLGHHGDPMAKAPLNATRRVPDLTALGQGMGTPGYTSSEQAEGRLDELTTGSDVFSLGAILYHLLTGQPPLPTTPWHTPENWEDYIRIARSGNFTKPSLLNPQAGADLDAICARCLDPDPGRRASSAADLATQLDHWLADEPLDPPWRSTPRRERIQKWMRRRPVVAGLAVTVALCVLLAVLGATWWHRAAERTAQAEIANQRRLLQRIESHFAEDRADLALASLARAVRERPDNRAAAERLLNALGQRTFLVPTAMAMVLPLDTGDFNPGRTWRAGVEHTNSIVVRDATNGNVLVTIPEAHQRVIRSARFSPDGQRLVSAGADSNAVVWNVLTGQRQLALPHSAPVNGAEFSPDGSLIVTAARDNAAHVWDARNGQLLGRLRHGNAVSTARFSVTGESILTASHDRTIRLWNPQTFEPASEPGRFPTAVLDARFAADGRHLVAVTFDNRTNTFLVTHASPWVPATAEETAAALSPTPPSQRLTELRRKFAARSGAEVMDFTLSPDERLVAAGCGDGAARVCLARTLEFSVEPLVHDSKVNCVRFSPDSRRLVTSTSSGDVRLWDVQTGQPLGDSAPCPGTVLGVAFSNDGRWALTSAGWKIEVPMVDGEVPAWLPQLVESFLSLPGSQEGKSQDRFRAAAPLDDVAWRHLPGTNPLVRWIGRALGLPQERE